MSVNNDVVDRMARSTIDDTVKEVSVAVTDVLFEGCPLQLMGPPVAQTQILAWVKANLGTLDASIVDKHLMKAFAEMCKTKDVALTKQTIQRTPMLRAERMSLEVSRVTVEKVE